MQLDNNHLIVGQAATNRTRQLVEGNGSFGFRTTSASGPYARGLVVQNNAGTVLAGAGWLGSDETAPGSFHISSGNTSWWDRSTYSTGVEFAMGSSTYVYIKGESPTVWWQDTNNRSFAIHVNSDVAYFMRGGVNDTTWTTITADDGNNRWPVTLGLSDGAFFIAGRSYHYGMSEFNVANNGTLGVYAAKFIRGNSSNYGKVIQLNTYDVGGGDGPQIHFLHSGVVEWGFGIQYSDGTALAMYAGGGTSGFGTERFRFEYGGNFWAGAGITAVGNIAGYDIHANRGDGTGVIYLGGTQYLYFNGNSYNMPTYRLNVGGLVYPRGSGRGYGALTIGTGGPSGGADGDIHLVY